MTTAVLVPDRTVGRQPPATGIRWLLSDIWTMTWRNILGLARKPEAVFFSSVQPIMFVLLFRYVFGGAIHVPGFAYVNYLMPGIFVQTVAFGITSTAVGLSEDLHKGLIERFRALPMARSAVLAGRTTADTLRNVGVVVLITAIGYAVGFRVGTNAGDFIAGLLLLLLFAYALSWGFAFVGLSAPDSETAQVMSFPVLFPLLFASSAFVPVPSMPGWLQAFAAHQPVTLVTDAARALMIGNGPSWSTSDIVPAVAWCVGIFAVLAPIAVWRYRRAS